MSSLTCRLSVSLHNYRDLLWSIYDQYQKNIEKSVVTSRILQLIVTYCHFHLPCTAPQRAPGTKPFQVSAALPQIQGFCVEFSGILRRSSHWGSQPMDCQWSKKSLRIGDPPRSSNRNGMEWIILIMDPHRYHRSTIHVNTPQYHMQFSKFSKVLRSSKRLDGHLVGRVQERCRQRSVQMPCWCRLRSRGHPSMGHGHGTAQSSITWPLTVPGVVDLTWTESSSTLMLKYACSKTKVDANTGRIKWTRDC